MSITQFVASTGARMRVFDLGRRISKIGLSEFEAIEDLARPYPTPYPVSYTHLRAHET